MRTISKEELPNLKGIIEGKWVKNSGGVIGIQTTDEYIQIPRVAFLENLKHLKPQGYIQLELKNGFYAISRKWEENSPWIKYQYWVHIIYLNGDDFNDGNKYKICCTQLDNEHRRPDNQQPLCNLNSPEKAIQFIEYCQKTNYWPAIKQGTTKQRRQHNYSINRILNKNKTEKQLFSVLNKYYSKFQLNQEPKTQPLDIKSDKNQNNNYDTPCTASEPVHTDAQILHFLSQAQTLIQNSRHSQHTETITHIIQNILETDFKLGQIQIQPQ